MFIGHFALGFAAKKVDQKPSLGTFFIATQFIDLLWPLFLLLGIETVEIDPGNTAVTPLNFVSYPYSHSLLAVILWGVLLGGVYFWRTKAGRASIVLGSLVVSHWLLDLLTHRPDLPLTFGSEIKVGLGLWHSLPATFIVEILIFALGIFWYATSTRAKNKTGTYAFVGLVVFLLLVYVANLFGSPPPSADVIGYMGLSMWLIVAWGYWIDKNRENSDSFYT